MKLRKKQIEHLDRLRELHSVLSESELLEAIGEPFYRYEMYAQERFFKDVLPEIKKIAGGHAEKVSVELAIDEAYLSYKGQDKNGLGLKVSISLFTHGKNQVTASFFVKSARFGNYDFGLVKKTGVLTPALVIAKFREIFEGDGGR